MNHILKANFSKKFARKTLPAMELSRERKIKKKFPPLLRTFSGGVENQNELKTHIFWGQVYAY